MAKILVACEESQRVTIAFRNKGHEAYSCDLQPCSGGHPEWHYQEDVFKVLTYHNYDMLIAFPPCTYISSAGLHWCKNNPERKLLRDEGLQFLIDLYNQPIKRICIENPTGYANTHFRKPTQIIEPYYFGDNHKKRTCLWLKNLPRLNGLIEVAKNKKAFHPEPLAIDANGKKRYFTDVNSTSLQRSKTFPSIALAMTEQWSLLLD